MYVVAKPTSEKEARRAGKEGQGGGGAFTASIPGALGAFCFDS